MSRVIVNDHLYTPDEVAYLEARNRYREIANNRKLFGPGGAREHDLPDEEEEEDDVLELDKDIYEYVVGLTTKQTQAALRKANLDTTGNEHEIKTLLAQYLQVNRDANRVK